MKCISYRPNGGPLSEVTYTRVALQLRARDITTMIIRRLGTYKALHRRRWSTYIDMNDITPVLANLVGLWCSSLLYGVNMVLYFLCLHILMKRRSQASWILTAATTTQFTLSTIHVACGLRSLIEGFVWHNNFPGDTYYYWLDMSLPVHVVQEATTMTNCLIGDAILIWRLYVVWGQRLWICVIPMIISTSFGITGYVSIHKLTSVNPLDPSSVNGLLIWLKATWSLSLATQLGVTLLIASRIWWVSRFARKGKDVESTIYLKIVWTLVESGALYAFTAILLLAFFNSQAHVGTIIGDALGQICAIVPLLIIVRVHNNKESVKEAKESPVKNRGLWAGKMPTDQPIDSQMTYETTVIDTSANRQWDAKILWEKNHSAA